MVELCWSLPIKYVLIRSFHLLKSSIINLPGASGGVPSAFEFQVIRAPWNPKISSIEVCISATKMLCYINDMLLSWTLTAPMHTAIASSLSKEAAHVFLNSSLSDSKLSMLSSLCPIWKEWPPSKISKQMKYTSFNRATFVDWFIFLLPTSFSRYFASWPVISKLLWHWKVLCKEDCCLNDSQFTVHLTESWVTDIYRA